jgi:hypothetical protein
MDRLEGILKTHPSVLSLDDLICGDVNLSQGGQCRSELRKRYNDPNGDLPEFLRGYENWKKAKTNGPNQQPQQQPQQQYHQKTTEEWLAERDAIPPDTSPIEPLCRKIIASGWDYSGFNMSPEAVRAFIENKDMWPLSEAEMTRDQRRLFRAVKDKWNKRLRWGN